jgi:hypothetical protein
MIDHFNEFKLYFELIHDPNSTDAIEDKMLVSSYASETEISK